MSVPTDERGVSGNRTLPNQINGKINNKYLRVFKPLWIKKLIAWSAVRGRCLVRMLAERAHARWSRVFSGCRSWQRGYFVKARPYRFMRWTTPDISCAKRRLLGGVKRICLANRYCARACNTNLHAINIHIALYFTYERCIYPMCLCEP